VTSTPWPTELRLSEDRKRLAVTFDSGEHFDLSAELLRVTSPSAEVQGHAPSERKTVGGKRNVTILAIDPIGNYAVRLGFDDGHNTGLYTFSYLHELGTQASQRFESYVADLVAKGLTRDTPGTR
jgi:DUF971 family protein